MIQSVLTPTYKAKADTLEINADYTITPALSRRFRASQTGYGADLLHSTQDFNNFNTAPGIFADNARQPGGVMCDPRSWVARTGSSAKICRWSTRGS